MHMSVLLLRANWHRADNNTPDTWLLTVCKAKFGISSWFTRVHEPETWGVELV